MAQFVVHRDTPHSPAEAWARLVDWPQHGAHVPLTSITVTTPAPNGVGTSFIARTGLGRVGFDDPMEVTDWHPPVDGNGRCRLVKRGRVMLGWAELAVEPRGTGAHVTWREDISLAHAPRLADAPTALSSRLLFGRVLRRLLES